MEIFQRLRELREKRYASAADAAKAMGMPYTTYAGHENGSRGITRKQALQYAKFFSVSIEYLLTGRHNTTGERALLVMDGERMPVRGFVLAGAFQESYAPEREETLPISGDARYPGRRQFALLIKGSSINRRAKDGEYAVCVEHDGPVKDGDVVVVERRRAGLFEATIKVVRKMADRVELWPDSDDPHYKTPVVFTDGLNGDSDEVAIVAKVIAFYRSA